MEKTKKIKFKVPHVYALLVGLIIICAILTYIIPAGQYDMKTLADGREVVDAATFHYIDQTPVGLMGTLAAVFNGMVQAGEIIFLIFIFGAYFGVVIKTGAIDAGLIKVAKVLQGKEVIIIPVMMVIFSLMGCTIGSAEDLLPYIPICVSLALALGFDSLTGVAMVLLGASAGFTGSFMNPYTEGVAQSIAELPLFSGMKLRVCVWILITLIDIVWLCLYARKIKKKPELSPTYEIDIKREDKLELDESKNPFTVRKMLCLVALVVTIVMLVYGTINLGYWYAEICGLFFGLAIVTAIIGGLSVNEFAEAMSDGMAGICGGALVCGFARGIMVVLNDGNIMHTILHAAASILQNFSSTVSAVGMYIFQCLLNFIVPSGSGQAAVSMPIMAPLADLTGVTRQTACLAFQFGDGISNIFTPTSGYFMASLALAKIPYEKWAKWILPIIGIEYLIGAIVVIGAQITGFGPF